MKKFYLLALSLTIFSLGFGLPNLIKRDSVATEPEKKAPVSKKHSPPKKLGKYVLKNPEKVVGGNQENNISALLMPSTTATKTVAVQGGGNAVQGSQLNYTIVVSNSGTDATAVSVTDVLVADLTLVAGSVKATPIGVDESYNATGNVGITVPANGLLSNDISPDNSALSVTAGTFTGTNGGTFVIAANGSFTYINNPGFTGNDAFTYTINTANGKTSTATVIVAVSNTIWFINFAYAGGGSNGTLAKPFITINAFQAINNASKTNSGEDGDIIYVYAGTYNTSAITLRTNQKLFGESSTNSFLFMTGITTFSYTNTTPTTNSVSTTTIANTTSTPVTLGSDNHVQGFTSISSSSGTTMFGASVGALKIKDVSITATAGQALQITAGGALDVQFKSISAAEAAKGLSVNGCTGSFQVLGTGTTAGSGGTISSITTRGAEFITVASVTLKNMNFTNANTTDGTLSNTDNTAANAAIHVNTVSGLTLDNIAVSGTTTQVGLNLSACSNVSVTSSSFANCGTSGTTEEGGIIAKNLSGTCSLSGVSVTTSGGRNVFVKNSGATTLTSLTVTNSTFNTANGDANFFFEGNGTSTSTVTFKTNSFINPMTNPLAINANGSCTINAQVGGPVAGDGNTLTAKTVAPGTNGLYIQGTGTANVNYNVINNTIQSSFNGLFPVNIGNQGTGGQFMGRINNNTVNYTGTGNANGIFVAAYGRAKHICEIKSNTENNTLNYGIAAETNDNATAGADGTMDVTIQNNIVNMRAGGLAYSHYNLTSNNIGATSGNMVTCGNLSGNTSNAVVVATNLELSSNIGVGFAATKAQIKVQGNFGVLPGAWTTPNPAGGSSAINAGGGGAVTLTGAFTCLTPTNTAAARIMASTIIENNESNIAKNEEDIISEKNELVIEKPQSELEVSKENSVSNQKNTENNINFANSVAAPNSGETITVNGSGSGFSLPATKSTTITFSATIAALPSTCLITNQATILGSNFSNVLSNTTTTSLVVAGINAGSTISATSVCPGGTVGLTAVCPSGIVNWFTVASGGSSVATGSPYNPTNITTATSYYAACAAGTCVGSRTLVGSVTINAAPTASITATPNPVCQNSTLNLSAPAGAATYLWSGNGVVAGNFNTRTAVPTAIGTQTYSLTVTKGSCSASATTTVIVNPQPNATITATPNPICQNSTLNLSAPAGGTTYLWSGNGVIVGNFNTRTAVPTANGSQTYSLTVTTGSCSASATTAVFVNNQPSAPTISLTTASSVCSPSALNLIASACAETVTWSQGATTGTSLSISAVGTYSITATCTVNGCTSNPSNIINGLNIFPAILNLANPIDNLTGSSEKIAGQINANNIIEAPADVLYKARNSILLTPGFTAGVVFKAEIGGCSN